LTEDEKTLLSLLHVASQQSAPFQSLIHDYALDVIKNPETHRLFTQRLRADQTKQAEIAMLKDALSPTSEKISLAMNDVLTTAITLPTGHLVGHHRPRCH
jgi:hypothetical protein